MIFLLPLLGVPPITGKALLNQVAARLARIQSLSVTLNTEYVKPKRNVSESFVLLKGGFMRYSTDDSTLVSTPDAVWAIFPKTKEYVRRKAAPKGTPQNPFIGMPGLFGEMGMSPIGNAVEVVWHGQPAYEVELDASKQIPKHPHLLCFFTRDTKLPLGFQLSQLAFQVEGTYVNLKLDPPLKPKDFEFTPGPGWKPAKPVQR